MLTKNRPKGGGSQFSKNSGSPFLAMMINHLFSLFMVSLFFLSFLFMTMMMMIALYMYKHTQELQKVTLDMFAS